MSDKRLGRGGKLYDFGITIVLCALVGAVFGASVGTAAKSHRERPVIIIESTSTVLPPEVCPRCKSTDTSKSWKYRGKRWCWTCDMYYAPGQTGGDHE
jgi:hypothetical protein